MAHSASDGLRKRLLVECGRAAKATAAARVTCERSKVLVAESQRLCDESRRVGLLRNP
jgi:hypothetical protein